MKSWFFVAIFLLFSWLAPFAKAKPPDDPKTDVPRAHDQRLVVELFAASPDIVHPIGIAFDRKGRMLVIESHTHFPPEHYQGPKFDRIRVLEDTDGDGKADRFTTFFEGTKKSMNIAAHPDGAIYLATRNEILRLMDTQGVGKADRHERIIFLDTKGDYPHNGLSGLSFDSKGNLYFGMGENLGADYKLTGSDGTTLTGGGEGGSIFWCTADGKNLRRIATGFWNPFGTCRDIFGRMFAVDNDPDSMPPCRMLHVIEGGDYGYQFRYGRSGRHVFQAWNGELPGTLPYVTGTGEAPCQVLSYESDGLPAEYLGNLLVTSWADHRIERYIPKERGSSFTADRLPFVQGGKDFRPVGLAMAPDGSLYVTDWVLKDYTLHGKGAIWHIRWKDSSHPDRPTDPKLALASHHRPLREAAARKLASDDSGRAILRQQLNNPDLRVRAAGLTALVDARDRTIDLKKIGEHDSSTGIRAIAVRALVSRGEDVGSFLDKRYPHELRREAVASLGLEAVPSLGPRGAPVIGPELRQLLIDPDPFIRTAAIQQLAAEPDLFRAVERPSFNDAHQRAGVLLALRSSNTPQAIRMISKFLADPDEDVRFLAAKWIADEQLVQYRPLLVMALQDQNLNVRMYMAYSTALARVDKQEVNEAKMADYFALRLADEKSSPALRVKALQLIPPTNPKITLDLLGKLLNQPQSDLQLEAARALCEYPKPERFRLLLKAANDSKLGNDTRAQAIVGLAEQATQYKNELIQIATGDNAVLRDEALRALVQVPLSAEEADQLKDLAKRQPSCAPLVARVLGQNINAGRPPAGDIGSWLNRLSGPGDISAGRRVFFHSKIGGCFRCHRVEGRGTDVGPDLSTIGRTERRGILESILQPSNQVAPSYQTWRLEMNDGKVHTAMLINTYLDEYTYVDEKGRQFKVNTRDVAETRPLPTSIMPDGLADVLTDQELRDLLAYLCSRK
jgi:putative membrane-bound dehydrogenase-like protein